MNLQLKAFIKSAMPGPVRRAIMIHRLAAHAMHDEPEVRELKHFVSASDIAVDAGCNIGVYTYVLSQLAQKVIAFEPHPRLAQRMKNLRLNNVRVEEIALAAESGTATLTVPDLPSGDALGSLRGDFLTEGAATTFTVRMECLDTLGIGMVNFLKIDVEGFEEKVLDGAIETITQFNPIMLIEIEERHNPGGFDRIHKRLTDMEYKGYFFDHGWKPLAEFNFAKHQDPERLSNLGRVPRGELGYISNFLFMPQGKSIGLH